MNALTFVQHTLLLDVPACWDSALIMIKNFLLVVPVVIAGLFGSEHHHLCPNANQTRTQQDLQELLEPFERATKLLSSGRKPTVTMLLPILHRFLHRDCKPSEE